MKSVFTALLIVLIFIVHPVIAQSETLPDTSQVLVKIINNKKDPFDKQIALTDKASQKVIKTIYTKELNLWPMNNSHQIGMSRCGAGI